MQLQRELTIVHLDVDLDWALWQSWIRFRGVHLANATWGQRDFLTEIEDLTIRIDFWALLQGRWVLPEVVLTRPILHLELSPQNIPNWVLGQEQGPALHITIDKLTLQEGLVTFLAPHLGTDFNAQIKEQPIPGHRAFMLHGSGRVRNGHAELEFRSESLAALLAPPRSFSGEGCFTWGYTHGRWSGTLATPLLLQGSNFELEMTGPSPAVLFPIIGVKLPELPPYRVSAQVAQQDKKWIIQNLQATVGGSDFAGNITWEETASLPRLSGRLTSNQLTLLDIGIGTQVPTNLPVRPEPMAMDVNLEFHGSRVMTPLVLDDVKTVVRIEHGQLRLDALNFGFTGGQVRARVNLDTHYQPMPILLAAQFQKIDLNQLLAPLDISQQNRGMISGRMQFASDGGSITDILTSAEGDAVFIVTRGQLDSLLLALVRLDLAKTFNSLLLIDNSVELHCAVAQLRAHQGIFTLDPLVIDTTSTKVTGSGTVDLQSNQLDLTFEPHPKDLSLFSAYSPFRVTGSVQAPEVRPKVGNIGGRMAAAAALAALVGPIGAIMPFISPGIGEDNDCQDLMRSSTVPFDEKM